MAITITISISPEIAAKAQERAAAAGLTVDAYLAELICEDEWVELDAPPNDKDDPEFEEIRTAVMEGLEQADRGELVPVREFFAELRAR